MNTVEIGGFRPPDNRDYIDYPEFSPDGRGLLRRVYPGIIDRGVRIYSSEERFYSDSGKRLYKYEKYDYDERGYQSRQLRISYDKDGNIKKTVRILWKYEDDGSYMTVLSYKRNNSEHIISCKYNRLSQLEEKVDYNRLKGVIITIRYSYDEDGNVSSIETYRKKT